VSLPYKEGKVSETKGKVSGGSAKKKLVPTEVGRKVVVFLNQAFEFMDYRFTSETESKLDSISESKLNYS
jgi:DNA topoisomerase IA